MAFDPRIFRNNKDGIGAPGDPVAENATDPNTLISLTKKMVALLSGGTGGPSTGATEAKQDIGNASLAAISASTDGVETLLTTIDGRVDGLETIGATTNTNLGAVTEAVPANDTASSGLNGRLQRVAQRITTLIALLPASLGAKTAANSLAITTATDDASLAFYGAVTETAPASDTASSGLNGRLQRIAQRLTSLISLLPSSIGAKSAAGSLSITTATDDPTLTLYGAVNETAPATDTASSGFNGRLQRIAQRVTALIALLPASIGAKTAAGSLAVTTATDDPTLSLYGSVTETAPASDTASSGLNGRLQRVAQRITSLIALFPASLGQKTMANAFAVSIASDQSAIPTAPGASASAGGISSTKRLLSAAASTNADFAKASAGRIYSIQGYSVATAPRFLKLYNKASAPTVGTDTPIKTLAIPAGSAFALDWPSGLYFSIGIAFAITTGVADSDTGALASGDVLGLNLDYA